MAEKESTVADPFDVSATKILDEESKVAGPNLA